MLKLSDYTPEQIARFNKMKQEIARLNKAVSEGGHDLELPYSKDEIAALSRYDQLVLADKASKHVDS